MTTAVYDGSFEGLLSLAEYLFRHNIEVDAVSDREDYSSLFSQNIYDDGNYKYDLSFVKEPYKLKTAFLANYKNKERCVADYYIESRKNRLTMETSAKIEELSHLTLREAHKFKGFLRFEMTELGFFARFAPKHNILEIVARHFCQRFSDRRVIFDENRGVAALIDGGRLEIVSASVDTQTRNDVEEEFVRLWKSFFNSVSIIERKNERAQKNFVPLRYRGFMNEFCDTEYATQAAESHRLRQ